MNVVYYTIEGKYDDLTYKFESLEDLLSTSDFISLHVPYDKKTGYLIGKREFELMKEGVYLINCARGKVVDEEALVEALDNGKVAGAGIDVFEQEPFAADDPLHGLPNVVATPHVAGNTQESLVNLAVDAAKNILAVFAGQMPDGLVNPEVLKNTTRVRIG